MSHNEIGKTLTNSSRAFYSFKITGVLKELFHPEGK